MARSPTPGPPASWLAAVVSGQAASPRGVLGQLIGRVWVTETAAVNDSALDLLEPQPHEHVLEIGFGPGRAIRRLSARAAEVTGVEVSDAMLAVAHRRNSAAIRRERVRLLHGDGTTLPLADDSVDAALAVHTLYFWPNPEITFREIARVLRPGGRLVLAFRDTTQPPPRRFDLRIYHLRSTDTIGRMLHAAGFSDLHTHHQYDTAHPVTLLRAHTAAHDVPSAGTKMPP